MKIIDFIQQHIGEKNLFIDILPLILNKLDGSILEIGAGVGETTVNFLKISNNLNRKTVVIDPFESGWEKMPNSYGNPYPYHSFYQNTKEYSNSLILIKKLSQETSVEEIKKLGFDISYSFIDGLQDINSILLDLKLCVDLSVDLIVLDDFERNTEISKVPEAVHIFFKTNSTYSMISQNHDYRCKVFLINNKIINYDF